MATLNISVSVSGVGGSITQATPRTTDGGGIRKIEVPASQAGTLSTRTSDTAGTLTLGASHGITTADVIDLYWSGGKRRNVVVGTVSGTSVPISGGAGDVLPAQDTAIVAAPQIAFNADIDGDALAAIAIQQKFASPTETVQSHVHFLDASDTAVANFNLQANTPRVWDVEGGDSNDFTGEPITQGVVSNGSATADATLNILWVQDNTA